MIIHLINACLVWWVTLLVFTTPALKDNANHQAKKIRCLCYGIIICLTPAGNRVGHLYHPADGVPGCNVLLYHSALYIKARLTDKGSSISCYMLFPGP